MSQAIFSTETSSHHRLMCQTKWFQCQGVQYIRKLAKSVSATSKLRCNNKNATRLVYLYLGLAIWLVEDEYTKRDLTWRSLLGQWVKLYSVLRPVHVTEYLLRILCVGTNACWYFEYMYELVKSSRQLWSWNKIANRVMLWLMRYLGLSNWLVEDEHTNAIWHDAPFGTMSQAIFSIETDLRLRFRVGQLLLWIF
jgi:hypothetical protein